MSELCRSLGGDQALDEQSDGRNNASGRATWRSEASPGSVQCTWSRFPLPILSLTLGSRAGIPNCRKLGGEWG